MRVVHSFIIRFDFLTRRWNDTVILVILKMVFQMLYVE